MKRFVVICLVLLIAGLSATAVFAKGELTIEKENLVLYSDDAGFYFAKIVNTGDSGMYVKDGSLEIFDAAGMTIVSDGWVTSYPSSAWLEPGEAVYISDFIWDSALKSGVDSYKLTIGSSSWGTHYSRIDSDGEFYFKPGSYDNAAFVTMTNKTDSLIHDFVFIASIYDEADNLIFVDYTSVYDIGLHPGGSLTAMFDIDSSLTEYYVKSGINPARIETEVYLREEN